MAGTTIDYIQPEKIGAANGVAGLGPTKKVLDDQIDTRTGSKPVGRNELVVNVRDYGAKGVGTDDTAAISAAIAAIPSGTIFGETVSVRLYFPAGRYIDQVARVFDRRLTVVGDGEQATVLYRGADATGEYLTFNRAASGPRDLSIDQSINTTATGAHVVFNAAYFFARNVHLSKPGGHGIHIGKAGAAIGGVLDAVMIRAARKNGIYVEPGSGSTDGRWSNLDVGQCYLAAIRIDNGGQNLSLVHVWGSGIGGTTVVEKAGIVLNSSSNVLIGCQSETNLGAGLLVTGSGSGGNVISDGKWWANVGNGIYVLDAPRTVIADNAIYNNGVGNTAGSSSASFAGVAVENALETTVEGNKVFDLGNAVGAGSDYPAAPPSPFPGRAAVLTQSAAIAEVGTADLSHIIGNQMRKERTRSGQPAIVVSNNSRWEANDYGDLAVPSVASAATIRVPAHVEYVDVTGQVAIGSIIRRHAGRTIRLRFTDAAPNKVTNGATIRLAGNVDYQPAQYDVLTLVSTGITVATSRWDEVGRTANPDVVLTQAEYDAAVTAGTISPTTFYRVTP